MTRYTTVYIALTWLWCHFSFAESQDFDYSLGLAVHPLYLEEEAPRGFAFQVLRDNHGFLWVADDIGLKRYDGYTIRSFNYSPDDPTTIGSSIILSIYLDDDNTLWAAGTQLNQYHPETETFTRHDVSDNVRIWAMHREDDIMWFGGEGLGLRAYDLASKKLIHRSFEDSESRFIRIIKPYKDDLIWIGSSSGLYLFNTKTFEKEKFPLPQIFEQGVNRFVSATVDDDKLWLATTEGIFAIDAITKKVKQYVNTEADPNVLLTNITVSILKDSKGRIWVGTDKNGVQLYQPSTDSFIRFPSYSNEYSFPPGAVNHIHEDLEGNLWFAVASYGTRRVSTHLQTFTAYRHKGDIDDSLGFNRILDLLEDNSGDIWIAADGGGLDKMDIESRKFTHYTHDPLDKTTISSNSVLSLAQDQQGKIWIGTWGGGLNILDPKTGKVERVLHNPEQDQSQTIADNNIFWLEIGKSGLVYIGVWQMGLQIYDPSTREYKSYLNTGNYTSDITNPSINTILLSDDEKQVWIGGRNGLELFDTANETFTLIDLGDLYSINAIHKQDETTLWLATASGLIRYNTQSGAYKRFSMTHGLSNDFIVSIEQDDLGYLWLGSQNGLNRFDPDTEDIRTYNKGDGLAGSSFNRASHLKTKNGTMYFGGDRGMTSFNPTNPPTNLSLPQVHLTKFEVYQKEVRAGDYPWFPDHVNYTKEIRLPYHLRDISFEFTGLSLISPADNRYRYRLLGLEKEWTEVASSRRRVRYTNLESGHYQFEVTATNNDGVWSKSTKTITLIVLPPWWEYWWVRSIFILLPALCIYLLHYWRIRLNIARQKELKQLVLDKTGQLNRLNTDLECRVEQRTSELSVEIEERKLAESKLFYMAFHDQLTGLPNRSWLTQSLEELMEKAEKDDRQFSLFFLDGDRFKQVNDTLGHRMGDMLLKAATERLCNLLNKGQHAARLGGDEFTILLEKLASPAEAESLAKDIIEAFDKPFTIEKNTVSFRVSIGVLICDKQYSKPSQALRDADVAMYKAKAGGRGTYRVFDKQMREDTLQVAQIELDLHRALKENEFYVVYQPIVTMEDNKLAGFEALIRWNHPTRGLIPPDKFISVAEYLGLIMDIGIWVLEHACIQYKVWSAIFPDENLPYISINLSPLQLSQPSLIHKVDEVFAKTNVPSHKIKMEITESALAENTSTANSLLKALRDRDVELMIDDFGTGYSSLSYLDRLPVQILKIDRKFVESITDPDNQHKGSKEIVKATITLAHNLQLKVIAEGIETQEQWDKLRAYKCDFGQGYFISRPMKPKEATEYILKSRSPPPAP